MTMLILLFFITLLVSFLINIIAYYYPLSLFSAWREECYEFLNTQPNTSASKTQKSAPAHWSLKLSCNNCKQLLPLHFTIPLFNIFSIKKQCHHCQSASPTLFCYANIFNIIASYIVWHYFGVSAAGIFALIFTWLLVTNALIDFQHHILPDQITLSLLWLGLIINTNHGIFTSISSAIYGAVTGYLLLFIIHHTYKFLCKKEGMGYGDFKILAAIGAWLGFSSIPFVLFLAAFLASLIMGFRILIKKSDSQQAFAFGPYIAFSGWIMLIWGPTITSNYIKLING